MTQDILLYASEVTVEDVRLRPEEVVVGWKKLQYVTEPPTGGAFNKLKFASKPPVSGAWNKLLYEGES